jgi:putative restriction endonuclease
MIKKFKKLNQAVYKGKRAPHKPLLILLALAKLQQSKKQYIPYETIDHELRDLLIDFGPLRKRYQPDLPFYHLQNDDLWEIKGHTPEDQNYLERISGPARKYFLENKIMGGFPDAIYSELVKNAYQINEIAEYLLNVHFPESYHEDILSAIGLNIDKKENRRRDPKFREDTLVAYEYKCAICGFSSFLNRKSVGLDAAHIKWFQAGGPDNVNNGLLLCVLHHKLFDMGLITIDDSLDLRVSEKAHGTDFFDSTVLKFNGQKLRNPIRKSYYPKDEYLNWHGSEVFHGPMREK